MSYNAYVTTLKNLRPHPNADRLQLAECFGNTICVSLDYTPEQIGIYFPTDGQLSEEFAIQNNLIRRKDENGNNIGGYMDPEKRNVKAIKLRGEKSDGLFLPLSCLDYCYPDINGGAAVMLNVGDTINVINGHEICRKYIPKANPSKAREYDGKSKKKKTKKLNIAPLFDEHKDTEQLAYNLAAFRSGDLIEITRKLHGTSGRTSHTKVLKGFKRSLLDRILFREGTPIYDWGYVSGTRRTVLDTFDGGFYGCNRFREKYHNMFEGKLLKGETAYYEIVGFIDNGTPIMGICNNKKLNDKEFVKKYGETTTFSYGCYPTGKKVMCGTDEYGDYKVLVDAPQSDIYVYRMTMTNEDGDVIEYTPEYMRYRCEQMGIKTVPVHWYGFIPDEEIFTGVSCEFTNPGEFVLEKAEEFYDGEEPIDPTHIREGVVVRIVNRPTFTAYKHKNFTFKVLEGIIKETAEAPDMEEADGLENNE